jgi:hypothetical protein
MHLTESKFGIGYKCKRVECRGSHGAHPDGSPHGIPADARTRKSRSEAHEVFDRVWRIGGLSRTEAYTWMRQKTGIYHISEASTEQCRTLIRTVYESFPSLKLDLD